MKYKNIILIIGILLLSSFSFATENYDNGESVPIDATYTVGGLLTSADANLTVTFPNGSIDIEFSNYGLTEVATGVFSGSYTNTEVSGTYKALVVFYNGSTEVGRKTQIFTVGDENLTASDVKNNTLEMFESPTNYVQLAILFGYFILAFVIYGIGFKMRGALKPIFLFIGGFMMFLLPFYIISSSVLLGVLIWVFGLAMMYSAFSVQF